VKGFIENSPAKFSRDGEDNHANETLNCDIRTDAGAAKPRHRRRVPPVNFGDAL
jgi:hypothetical protein